MKDFVFIGEGLKAKDPDKKYNPNFNVLNILRCLIEDENSTVYIPYDYKNGTKDRKVDPKVHYLPYEAGRPVKITGIQSNKERFNFSLTGIIDIAVEVEQEDGSVDIQMKKVFRQYNVIRDGKLVIDRLVAKLSEQSFIDLRDSGILFYNGLRVLPNHHYNRDFLYKIVLTDVPLISLNWARPINLGLYEYMIEEINLSNRLSSIRRLIKEYKDAGQTLPAYDSDFYVENHSVDYEDNEEKISVPCVVYEFKNIKDDPKIYEVKDEVTRKFYPDLDSAEYARKELNARLINVRFLIRCIVMAIEMSAKQGSYEWSEKSLVKRSKDKYEQTCEVAVNDKVMTLRRLTYNAVV